MTTQPPETQRAGDAASQELPELRRPLTLRAGLLAFLLVLFWGGQPVAIKAGLEEGVGPLRLSAIRMALGGAVVLIYAVVTRTRIRPSRGEVRPLLGLGVLFVVQTYLMYAGGDQTSSGHASVLIFSFPLWTAVLGHIFIPGDHMSIRRTFGLLIAYGGVVVVFVGGLSAPGATIHGDLMTASSAMLLASRQIYLAHFSHSIHPARLLLTQSVAAVVVFGILGLTLESSGPVWTTDFVIALVHQGIVIGGLGFIGNVWLIQRYLPSQVAATMLFAPICGVIFSWLLLGETLGYEVLVGVALLVGGSAIVQLRRQPSPTA
ncbi:MAG: DMT family transporter [Chloroflexi bacterium]|nr:DMT family transporter [Chloroflexota bacterium]MYF21803.1 DMT family transporter [Chloroflexota bacterium]